MMMITMHLMTACMLVHVIHGATTLFSLAEDTTPVRDTSIGSIDTADEMQIDLVVTVHSFPTGWANIFHVGNTDPVRSPAIWLGPESPADGFYCAFSNQEKANVFWTMTPIVLGVKHTIQTMVTQSRRQVYVDGVEVRDSSPFIAHDLLSGLEVYASDPWYEAADVTVHNLVIYDTILGVESVVDGEINEDLVKCDAMDMEIDFFLETCSAVFASAQAADDDVADAVAELSNTVDGVSSDLELLEVTVSGYGDRLTEIESALEDLLESLSALTDRRTT